MKDIDFKNSIAKYLTHSISSKELDYLAFYLEKCGNEHLFGSFVRIDYLTRYSMSEYNSDKAKEKLLMKIRKDKRSYLRFRMRKILKYAAVGILFLAIGYTYKKAKTPSDVVQTARQDANTITLQLADGSVKTISEEGSTSILNIEGHRVGLQKGNQLIYHQTSSAKLIAYNTLKVPYGKRFVLILSDGTKAHLNAGTSLKYPVEFIKGKNREVFLQGEGYFEVSKDEAHPFIISTNELNVQVLGTEFNLSAYPDDENIKTVLVEGSVGFFERKSQFDETHQRLEPGHMAVWEKQDKIIQFKETDTNLYTGWMDGKIIFSHMRFGEIIKKLERNYNVSIENTYQELNDAKFTASFDTETITQILQAFNKNFPMEYTIDGGHIHIKKP